MFRSPDTKIFPESGPPTPDPLPVQKQFVEDGDDPFDVLVGR